MAEDSNIKNVIREVGEQVFKSQTITEEVGEYVEEEVGLGTFSTTYTAAGCEKILGITSGSPASQVEILGDQRNGMPNFNFPRKFTEKQPHYCDFKINKVSTIGQTTLTDPDGSVGAIASNVNPFVENKQSSNINNILAEVGPNQVPSTSLWEFTPGYNSVLPNPMQGGNEDVDMTYLSGGKTIWEFK